MVPDHFFTSLQTRKRVMVRGIQTVWETVCTRALKQESEAVWETVCTRALKQESEAVWEVTVSAGHLENRK